MNIWILNHHALSPEMSGGTRHFDFASELIKRGHDVTIIASSFHYSKFKEMKIYEDKEYIEEKIDDVNFVWFKTSPYFGNGIGRVLNMLSYTNKAIKIIPKLNKSNPDIIIGSSVHLFAVYSAYRLSLKFKVPFIMEVRDLWPKTLIDMGMSKWHPFILLLGWMEKFLYKKANSVLTNLPYAYKYISKFISEDKINWISNGVDLNRINYITPKKKEEFIISYTGAIGIANNLSILLDVAEKLKEYSNIKIQIVGDGPDKENLKKIQKDRNITNVILKDSVPKDEVGEILSNSDILFFNLKDSPVFKYGISSNKLFDYMAAGRMIIFSSNAINNPIKESGAGISIAPDDINILEETILKIYKMSHEERLERGKQIRSYVENNYSIEVLVNKLEKLLEQELEGKNDKKSI